MTDRMVSFQCQGHGLYRATPEAVDAATAYFASWPLLKIQKYFTQNYGTPSGPLWSGMDDLPENEFELPRSALMVMAGEWCLGLHVLTEEARKWWRDAYGAPSPIPCGEHALIVASINSVYDGGWEGFAQDNKALLT